MAIPVQSRMWSAKAVPLLSAIQSTVCLIHIQPQILVI
jgi:hypothetical protein